jgi:hypothetical protein
LLPLCRHLLLVPAFLLHCIHGQLSNLLDRKAAEYQHSTWPCLSDPCDGIDHPHPLLIDEIVEEETCRLQVAGDRPRMSSGF